MKFNLAAALLLANAAANEVIVSFDGAEGTTFDFKEMNDPVMGGESTGSFTVESNTGVFDGEVVDVPFLKAPGFIKAYADQGDHGKTFKDVSDYINGDLVLRLTSTTPEYEGFRVTIVSGATMPQYSCANGATVPQSNGCYKAKFSVPASKNGEEQEIRIPVNEFSDHWSPYTGDLNVECKADSKVCITKDGLANLQRVEVWAEGVAGKANLQIRTIEFSKSKNSEIETESQEPNFLQ